MKKVQKLVQEHFIKNMCSLGKLFTTELSGKEIWDIYLSNFSEEHNPVFRDPESSSHNCNYCHNFFNRYSNIVAIGEDGIITIFDVNVPKEYKASFKAASKAIKASTIQNLFFETYAELNSLPYESCSKDQEFYKLGMQVNFKKYNKEEAEKYGVVKEGDIKEFNHLWLDLPKAYVKNSLKSQASLLGEYRSNYDVFKRGMQEIPLDTLELVKDLINQGSLLDGNAYLEMLKTYIVLKQKYDEASDKELWLWDQVALLPEAVCKWKNTLMGVLCTELAEGEELNKACKNWNKRVDPANYMKATAPITKKQIEEAKKFVQDNGYESAFKRRFATIDDIKVDEIKHINVGDGSVASASIFDNVKSTSTRHKRSELKNVEEVTIDKFMKDILPSCENIEVLFDNKHQGNLATFTTAAEDSKPIFKWDNPYSWTFNGNLAGKSQLREAVAAKGGRVDGAFRFSHSWNELERNQSLMDLHVFMPGYEVPKTGGGPNVLGRRVGWNNRKDKASGGIQDVDYVMEAPKGYVPVENITFPDISKMPEGLYTCKIHNWSFRRSAGKGKAEIEFDGQLYEYEYPATKHHQWITIAEVTLKNGIFTIDHKLAPIAESSKEVWGIATQEFHKVNLVCNSPNYWGKNEVGKKYIFFMLDGCKPEYEMRSFHNENLNKDLTKHRKVMEVLANTTMITPNGSKILSGLGFNTTVRDELIVKCSGNFKRILKVKF